MPDTTAKQLADGPAVPISLTVNRESSQWVVRAWYHGNSMDEALHPTLIAEYGIDPAAVPLNARWRDLYRAVAIALEDLAAGDVDVEYAG